MSTSSLSLVLGILRKLKSTEGLGPANHATQFVHEWSGDADPVATLKVAAGITEACSNALITINESALTEEAKAGLRQTVTSLQQMFSLQRINQPIQKTMPDLDPAITNFAILVSMTDTNLSDQANSEISDFIKEIEALKNTIDKSELDPVLKEIVKRHLSVLISALNNVETIGLEIAIGSYADLLARLANEIKVRNDDQSEAGKNIWDQIKKWSERIQSIQDLIDSGSKALPYLENLPKLTGF